jgi:hypothetical protein
MHILVYLAVFGLILPAVCGQMAIQYPVPRGHPSNKYSTFKDSACITAPLNGGAGCPPKPFPCGGYPIDSQVTTVLKAGEVFNVSFWHPDQNVTNVPSEERHNGGLCEFALSYDGGKSYTVIATYHKTCPDIFFTWPVKIPQHAPSCYTRGQCIFSWTWINAIGNREFYQNCVDVRIEGDATEPLPIRDITRANLPPVFTEIIVPDGDPSNSGNAEGSGPNASDVTANMGLNYY